MSDCTSAGGSMGKAQSYLREKTSSWRKEKVHDGKLTLTPDPNNRLQDQILGTIYGNCIGDAIGLMTEFLSKEEATHYYGGKHLEYPMKALAATKFMHQFVFPEADWTDDSDQMILILQSLIDNDGEANAVDFAAKLLHWMQHGFPELGDPCGMGLGRTTCRVLMKDDFKTDPHKAAHTVWEESKRSVAPNGGVMRTSIVGVHRHNDIDQVVHNTKVFCKVTHADPRCVASCVAVTSAISMMLRGLHMRPDGQYDVAGLTEAAFDYAKECLLRDEEGNLDPQQMEELKFHMNASLPELELCSRAKIGYTFKCLGAGFWALRQNKFRDAIEALTLEGGDADTNGAVAGALLGCKLGCKNLPPSWRDQLKHKKWLDDILERYFEMGIMTESCGTPVDGPTRGLTTEKQDETPTPASPELEESKHPAEPVVVVVSNDEKDRTSETPKCTDSTHPEKQSKLGTSEDGTEAEVSEPKDVEPQIVDTSDIPEVNQDKDVEPQIVDTSDMSEVNQDKGSTEAITDQTEVKDQSEPVSDST